MFAVLLMSFSKAFTQLKGTSKNQKYTLFLNPLHNTNTIKNAVSITINIRKADVASILYEGILWTKFTTYSVLQDFDQWRRVKRSEGEWR